MDLKDFLDQKYLEYCKPNFIENDPISIPHLFSAKEDIEISAFFTATISWGNRKMIIKNALQLMQLMENQPFEFVMNAGKDDLKRLQTFKHRTFQPYDLLFFIESLRTIYQAKNGLETVFNEGYQQQKNIYSSLMHFRNVFFEIEHLRRSEKHIPNVVKGASAKRLNMFLRWMVRKSDESVDFGLWKQIPASALMIPLDVHVMRVADKLGILERKQQDWKSVELLTHTLKTFDKHDPVKYDFALFGLGVSGF